MLAYDLSEDTSIRQLAGQLLGSEEKWPLISKANHLDHHEHTKAHSGARIFYPDSREEIDQLFLEIAIDLALSGVESNSGGPFGALVVKDDVIVGRGNNQVTSTNDPTAHAEMVAIRNACQRLGEFQLDDCTIYSSCEPCPMCLGAIYWARPARLIFGSAKEDAKKAGFDDQFIYEELSLPWPERKINNQQILAEKAWKVFEVWLKKEDKLEY